MITLALLLSEYTSLRPTSMTLTCHSTTGATCSQPRKKRHFAKHHYINKLNPISWQNGALLAK